MNVDFITLRVETAAKIVVNKKKEVKDRKETNQ